MPSRASRVVLRLAGGKCSCQEKFGAPFPEDVELLQVGVPTLCPQDDRWNNP